MQIIADLHLHSKYSRAVSQQMILPEMAKWAKRKGIDLLGTGDFTHPLWFRELKSQLEEVAPGLFSLRAARGPVGFHPRPTSSLTAGARRGSPAPVTPRSSVQFPLYPSPLFMLTTEVSSIYSQGGRLRRIHNIIFAPNLSVVEKINETLLKRGVNLSSDGRPIMGISSEVLTELVLGIDKNCLIVPAHVWTPWFSLFGSESGFDSLEECFGKMSPYIYAVETGLSSNPAMNWRISELNNRRIISFSDAHSGPKLGREATVFEMSEVSYGNIRRAITQSGSTIEDGKSKIDGEDRSLKIEEKNAYPPSSILKKPSSTLHNLPSNKIIYTIEFHPEEGKYHFTGHRNCKVKQSPEETKKLGRICPVCGKGLTVGVMHRVEQLAVRQIQNSKFKSQNDKFGVRWIYPENQNRPPYVMLVPLLEILAESLGSLVSSQKVVNEYIKLTDAFGGEFNVLLKAETTEIAKIAGIKVAEGIEKVRKGDIVVEPGYDGEFGIVKIWSNKEETTPKEEQSQLNLFYD